MRRFILTLFCILQIPVLAQTTRSDLSTTSASVRDWANRLTAKDPTVRATAEATLVQGAPGSLPLLIQPALRRSLGDEDAQVAGDAARALGALKAP